MNMQYQNIIQEIKSAFAKVEYPGDDFIVFRVDDFETEEVQRNFVGRYWESFTRDELLDNYAALFFFTPRAFKYYLPAYLIASMNDFHYGDALSSATMYSLNPNGDMHEGVGKEFFLERMSLLDQHQFDVTAHVIDYLLETFSEYSTEDDNQKLRKFWRSKSE